MVLPRRGHVEPIKEAGEIMAAKLRVYAGDAEEYPTFITPEAHRKLKQYIKLQESRGEKTTEDSPLIGDRWQTVRGGYVGEVKKPLRLKSSGVKRLFENAPWRFGLRKEKKKRHEFSIHSLRRFFKTRAEQMMKPINVETLMG
jgi:integrase